MKLTRKQDSFPIEHDNLEAIRQDFAGNVGGGFGGRGSGRRRPLRLPRGNQ